MIEWSGRLFTNDDQNKATIPTNLLPRPEHILKITIHIVPNTEQRILTMSTVCSHSTWKDRLKSLVNQSKRNEGDDQDNDDDDDFDDDSFGILDDLLLSVHEEE